MSKSPLFTPYSYPAGLPVENPAPNPQRQQGLISTNELGNGNQMPEVDWHQWAKGSWWGASHPPAPSHSGED